jgi:glutaminyl-tRNA synthetase
LFNVPDQAKADSLSSAINTESEIVLKNCIVEPALQNASPEQHFQFERIGYFVADRHDHSSENLVFNRTVTLRDTWAK